MNSIFKSVILFLLLQCFYKNTIQANNKLFTSEILTKEQHECRKDVLSMYLPTTNLSFSESASEEMLKMCPELKNSCCTDEELGYLHSQVLKKKTTLETFMENYIDLQNRILSLTKDDLDSLEVSLERTKCQKDENDLQVALKILKSRSSNLESTFRLSVGHFSQISSGFACSLCEQKNGFNFTKKNPNKAFISVDIDMCNYIFAPGRSDIAFGFFNDAYYINLFVESLSCIAFSPFSLEPVLNDHKLGDILHQANKCRETEEWFDNPRCLTVCSSLPFINQNIFYKMMTPVSIAKNMISKLFNQNRNKKARIEEILIDQMNKEKEHIKKVKNNLEFKYFVENEETGNANIEHLLWDVKVGSGWNFAQSPMQEFICSDYVFSWFIMLIEIFLVFFW
jgi:hypothetical protein